MTARPHIAINFHGLGKPHADVDEGERPYWLPFERFAEVVEQTRRDPQPHRFVFTFDDGNASDLEAAEYLAARSLTGRFYVLAGRLDDPRYLSRDDLRRLAAMGMTVGLHGRDHVAWTALGDAALADETVAARVEVSEALGQPVDEVAIPFGNYDRRVVGHLVRQGYRRILTSDRGAFDPQARIWSRNSLHTGMDDAAIEAMMADRVPPLRRLRKALSRRMRRGFH